jgi:membrane-bound lytic murein transglycosylase A
LPLSALPGWQDEDHLGALRALQTICTSRPPAGARSTCERIKSASVTDPNSARLILESNFRAIDLGSTGTLTAYYAPRFPARHLADEEFSAPVRPKPKDLPPASDPIALETFPDRTAISEWPSDDAIAWMRAEDLFFMQIQGSGLLDFGGGEVHRASFAGTNGKPFTGIAKPMKEMGLLPENNTSGDAIRSWLADHRGPQADAVINLNARYVFFNLAKDDGTEPVGAAGIPLVPRRSVAIDPSQHSQGSLFWIDAQAPGLQGAFPRYQALVMALDSGGAIKGRVRADYYLGTGQEAGTEAGRVKHQLRMFRLDPVP